MMYNCPSGIFPYSICAKILAQNVSFCCSSNNILLSIGNPNRLLLASLSSLTWTDTSCVVSILDTSKVGNVSNV